MARNLVRFTSTVAGLFVLAGVAAGQTSSPPKANPRLSTPEQAILDALGSDPVTAPYGFKTSRKDGRIVLAGRVGTREIHDRAVRLAMTVSASLDDRLVIDTAALSRGRSPSDLSSTASSQGGILAAGPAPYVYPPPLFGRLDEPFLGFEPPLISYPPWWGAVMARQGDPYAAPNLDPDSPIGPDPGPPRPAGGADLPSGPIRSPAGGPAVELTIDPLGTAILRGTVATDEIAAGIADKASRIPGVTRIVNRLEVRPEPEEPAAPIRNRDEPPPPPMPEPPRPAAEPKAAAPAPAAINPTNAVASRVTQAIARRPALKGTDVKAEVRDGVVTLTGKVPTVLEAMQAFRVAQQTVGVRDVIDRLEFKVPDGLGANPLIAQGRPDDVEPYLLAQLRRQLDDQAQVDRIKVVGDRLELRGTIRKDEDRPRIDAVLRSMPLLRGFTLDLKLTPE